MAKKAKKASKKKSAPKKIGKKKSTKKKAAKGQKLSTSQSKRPVKDPVRRPAPKVLERASQIYDLLLEEYPDSHCALNYNTPFELLVATILSAQCTDARVNMVTPELFSNYPDSKAMADAEISDIETLIKSTGFYRNKAKNILAAAIMIEEDFEGEIPQTMDQLLKLPGVARKTANVVLGNAFNINVGVVVDTHIGRLSQRMGLSKEKNPVKIEQDLMRLFEQSTWTLLAHLFISHGRAVCQARSPKCESCFLLEICPQKTAQK